MAMNALVLQLLLGVIEESPELFNDGKNLFHSIANGSGGIKKLVNATAAFSALAGHAANAAAMVVGATDVEPPPKPAQTGTGSLGGDTGAARDALDVGTGQTPAPTPAPVLAAPPASPPASVAPPAAPPVVAPGPAGTQSQPTDASGNAILNAADEAAKAAQG